MDLNSIYAWSQKWQLNLNLTKCKALTITNKRSSPSIIYNINDVSLDWVDTFTYLGVVLNRRLTWNDHALKVISKSSQVLNLLRRCMKDCSSEAKQRSYNALVRPHLEYCVPVWQPYQTGIVSDLEKVQKRAAVWILNLKRDRSSFTWSKSYDQCRILLKWPTLEKRYDLLSCCQLYKIIHHLDCLDFNTYFSFKTTSTRSKHQFILSIPNSRVNCYRYSFFIRVSFLWNSLPSNIVDSTQYYSFKSNFKNFLSR